MKRGLIRKTFCWPVLPALVALCGLFMLGSVGCNADVQTTVWQGANNLAVSLIDALFLAIKPVTSTTTTNPVTVSWITDAVTTVVC
jgi:hypothetical protein